MGFLDLFQVALMPVLEVLLITALGSILALDRVGVLGHNSRKSLNTLVFFVFSPALVGSYLAKTVTFEGLALLWFMPLNILFTYIFGSALGWILLKIAKPPQHLNGLLISSCSAANLGNLPLIIIPAICRQKGSPFGAPDICHKYGMTYASLAMAVGAVYLWSYVYNIVRVSASSSNHDEIDDIAEAFVGSSEPLLHHDFGAAEYVSLSVMIQKSFKGFQRKIHLKALLAPSTVGAIVGFAIGVIPLLRKSIIGGDAPLHVIEDSAFLLGDSTTPALTLILGANLIKGLRGSGSGVKPSLIVGIILIRYVLLPLVGIAIIKGAIHIGVLHTDPLYQFVLLLQYALPPALNIGTVTQLFGAGESECSVIMLWTYASASVSLTLWSTYFMWDSTTPALTLILGANLLKGLRGSGSGVKPSLIVGIIFIRYVFLPLVGIAIIKGAIHIGVLHTDPLYQFVLLLQYALPPALNIGTVTQLFGAGESECSVIMLWTYASASVSLTLWSTYFMWLVA